VKFLLDEFEQQTRHLQDHVCGFLFVFKVAVTAESTWKCQATVCDQLACLFTQMAAIACSSNLALF
jgi:hypothetical protein